ncbi:hypothetical protein R5R35_006686 [Gryllus longicercus]|uniref:Ras GTPase-activating protein 3 n=1 Tax=Gryllus longicercus TaxID=2509291 RepID=A0AAN9W9W2_9ORTH
MAEERRKARVEERLKIKIGEAKNLMCGGGGGGGGAGDVFCALSLDQEEIFRTGAAPRCPDPFFGEEFQFEVPRRFRHLAVYVHARDRDRARPAKVLGKVAVRRDELHAYHGKDHWFPLRTVDADSEVQGKAHLQLQLQAGGAPADPSTATALCVRVLECSELTHTNGACDPFATVALRYSDGRTENKRTRTRKKTTSPHFDDAFVFELPSARGAGQNHERHSGGAGAGAGAEWAELRVALWHDASGVAAGNVFLGEVRLPLLGQQHLQRALGSAWYFLQPRSGAQRGSPKQPAGAGAGAGSPLAALEGLGSLRLKIHYTVDYVFPSPAYDALRDLILQSPQVEPITSSAAYILGEIVPSKLDAAQPLVRVLVHHDQIVPMVRALAHWEISKLTDANTIFRGNTLVSKMMDEVMRLAGLHYLHNTLRPSLELLFQEHKPCEIDPTRVKDPNVIETNLNNLKGYVQAIFQAITTSALQCPVLMCQLFHVLKEIASYHFPSNREVKYSVISGFVFLRFFAPAILGPKLFDLTTEQIDQQTNRTLTLISKIIQSLGNLVSCRSLQQPCKEEYMTAVYQTFCTEQHIQAIRQFLEIISAASNPNPNHRNLDSPVILKEGVMIKRAQGRKRFGRKNFKLRYFRLTTQDLTYSKTKGKEPLCCIPLDQILAVERLKEESFKKKNMFQIVQPERALYVQANNCVEEKEWIDILTKICQTNANRLQRYHPSAFVNGHWLCCRAMVEGAPGCTDVSSFESEKSLQMNLDPDRELQRIHSLFISHMDRLEALTNACECQAVYTGDICFMPSFVIEDVQSCFKTLSLVMETAYKLEQEHRSYQRSLARETKYGSKQAPIGDDNYLLLAGRPDSHLFKTYSSPK